MGLDVRIPLGLIFLIIGGIMAVFGLFTQGDVNLYAPSLIINLNRGWGGIMMLFGVCVLFLGWRHRRPHENRKASGTASKP